MANQTLVAVPTKFAEFKQVRAFAIRLVEQLDIVLGYRSTQGYEVSGTAEELVSLTLTELTSLVTTLRNTTDALTDTIQQNTNQILLNSEAIETIQVGTAIVDTAYNAPAISATYAQSEVQDIADALEIVSDKLDTLFGVLRTAEIIT